MTEKQTNNNKPPLLRVVQSANGGTVQEKTSLLLGHKFVDESGEEYGGLEFGGFRQYMAAKQTKLQNQAQVAVLTEGLDQSGNNNEGAGGGSTSNVFSGCVIYVNGYTGSEMSSEQLQRLIILNGGVHVNHMWGGKTTVTHIVASTLTARKREMFEKYRVVKPDWLVQCVAQGRLVPWQEYRTIENGSMPGQTRLTTKPNPPALVQQPQQSREGIPKITDPAFIKHFYEHSRLHHLSMWKADLRRKYLNEAKLNSSQPSNTLPLPSDTPRIIMHVDYDSFFVSVALLSRPELRDKPVCVASGTNDSSDVASAGYVARQKYGVRNGMWLKRAREMCPQLVILRFDFEAYEVASKHLYDALIELKPDTIYPVSVDEAIVDVTTLVYSYLPDISLATEEEIANTAEEMVASKLRNKIRTAAGIEASVGIGNNMLLARIALAKAKPAGHLCIRWSQRFEALDDGTISLRDLPGVGRSVVRRLNDSLGVTTVQELREKVTQQSLEQVFGPRHGLRLWEVARGIDDTSLEESVTNALDRKSIGVEISWGVRADTREEVGQFIHNLVQEVCNRMKQDNLVGSNITLKVYRAQKHAIANRAKAFGHGMCDIYSKSRGVPGHLAPTSDHGVITDLALALMDTMECAPIALRGVGLQMTKLEKEDSAQREPKGVKSILRFVEPVVVAPAPPAPAPLAPITPVREQPQNIDWDIYAALPSTLRQVVKEEYNLPSTPRLKRPASPEPTVPSGIATTSAIRPNNFSRLKKPRLVRLSGAGQNTLTQQFRGNTTTNGTSNRNGPALFNPNSSQNYFAHPSIIDSEILKELPEAVLADLQRELKQMLHSNSSLSPSSKPSNGSSSNTTRQCHNNNNINVTPLRPPPLLDNRFTDISTQVYPTLSTWIQTASLPSIGGPHPTDIQVVVKYVHDLIETHPKYWTQASKVVDWVRRRVKRVCNSMLEQQRQQQTQTMTATENNKNKNNPADTTRIKDEWDEVVRLLEKTLKDGFEVQGIPI